METATGSASLSCPRWLQAEGFRTKTKWRPRKLAFNNSDHDEITDLTGSNSRAASWADDVDEFGESRPMDRPTCSSLKGLWTSYRAPKAPKTKTYGRRERNYHDRGDYHQRRGQESEGACRRGSFVSLTNYLETSPLLTSRSRSGYERRFRKRSSNMQLRSGDNGRSSGRRRGAHQDHRLRPRRSRGRM